GVSLSIPAQSVFVTADEPVRRQRKRDEDMQQRVRALQGVDLFHALTDDERCSLAERLIPTPFASGEIIVRQGVEAHHLYILTSGPAEVSVASPDGDVSNRVGMLHAGDFLGEMGMMTGEPRAATVTAITDVECYRLEKEAFRDILQKRPDLAETV